jgi:hypothetical protein
MDTQQVERLRALWKSGREKYQSFFVVLNEVRQEVGDDALPSWCYHNLRIGISVITEMSKTLQTVDREVVKTDLAAANKLEKEKHAAEAMAKRKAREDAAYAREIEKAERAKNLAEKRAAAAKADAEHKKAQDAEKTRQQRRKNPKERGAGASAARQKRALVSKLSEADLAELVKRFQKAENLCAGGIAQWIEGSVAKAMILCAARAAFTADQDFGVWIEANEIDLNHSDRAALVGLGRLGEEPFRVILSNTESRSYQLIWQQYRPLKVVGN